jgi:hypothetical protein
MIGVANDFAPNSKPWLAMAQAEAISLVRSFAPDNAQDVDHIADLLLEGIERYRWGADFGVLVIDELREMAGVRRAADLAAFAAG